MIHNLIALAIVLGALCLTNPVKAEDTAQTKETVSTVKVEEQKQMPSNVIAADAQVDVEEKVNASDKDAMAFNLEEDDETDFED